MFLVGLLSWWYGRGWIAQWRRMIDRWMTTVRFFSIGQLASTLFSPFRQISAASNGGSSIAVAFRAFFDKLISRIIGAFVRFFTILAGCIVIALQAVYGTILTILWLLLPVLPVIGFILLAIGFVPSWT
jgi:hypothetical protein